MVVNGKMRITALTCASILLISGLGASPFKINDTADGKVNLNIPEMELDSFNLDGGAAGVIEKDIYVEVSRQAEEKETQTQVEETVIEEQKQQEDFVMANVQNSVNVRAEANTDCEVVGMLYNKCGGKILEKGDGWTKIESGELVGWVRNDFLYFGDEAREYAEKVCDKIARVNVECLRIRKGPSTEAETDGLFEINSEWTVLDELEGWVEVDYKGAVRYVSAEYVDVEFFIENGETMEEIKAREAIAAMEKAKLTANRGAYSATVDETTLLGAIIQAEAGNQCYDGKLAVGAVVLNRVKSDRYPNSIAEVIYAPGQFGPASNGTLDVILNNGVNAECMQAAKEALEGATTVGDAKNFHRAGSGESGIVIGAHVFY